jgi:hypothetical protein
VLVCKNNCNNSFCHIHLISSVSLSQRSLIYDCIYFSFPTPVANISGKNFLGAFFILKVSRVPNFFMLPTPLITEQLRLLNWSVRF